MSLRTSSWLLPQNEQTRLPERSSCFAITASHASLGGPSVYDYLIDQPVFNRLSGRHEVVAIGILFQLLQGLAGVFDENIVELLARPQNLAGMDFDIAGLAPRAAQRLMNANGRMGQGVAPTLLSGREQNRAHAGREPEA